MMACSASTDVILHTVLENESRPFCVSLTNSKLIIDNLRRPTNVSDITQSHHLPNSSNSSSGFVELGPLPSPPLTSIPGIIIILYLNLDLSRVV